MKKTSSGGETIIAEGVKVEGDFTSDGNVVIEGAVQGNVSATGNITVGERAVIDADVRAQNLQAAGTIKGNVHVEERTDLLSTSVLQGDLSTSTLNIDAGSTVNGKITMSSGAAPAAEETEEE